MSPLPPVLPSWQERALDSESTHDTLIQSFHKHPWRACWHCARQWDHREGGEIRQQRACLHGPGDSAHQEPPGCETPPCVTVACFPDEQTEAQRTAASPTAGGGEGTGTWAYLMSAAVPSRRGRGEPLGASVSLPSQRTSRATATSVMDDVNNSPGCSGTRIPPSLMLRLGGAWDIANHNSSAWWAGRGGRQRSRREAGPLPITRS